MTSMKKKILGAIALAVVVPFAPAVGADIMHRVELGTLGPADATGMQPVVHGPVTVGHLALEG